MEKVTDYFSWAPKSLQMVTAVMKLKDTCSLEEKLWQTLDRLLKSRDITLPTKVPIVKAMISPVVIYRCESWNIKQAEHWRTDPCELWCWRVPWAARKGILKEILKEINPECSLKRLKLKLQYCGHLMWRSDSLQKTWMLGKTEGRRRRGWDGWMASLSQWTWVWANSGR